MPSAQAEGAVVAGRADVFSFFFDISIAQNVTGSLHTWLRKALSLSGWL
jgi:hypothetical protein